MSGVLIDTNIYALAMRGDPQVVETLRAISHIGFSVISAGELLSGFKGGNREAVNRSELNRFRLRAGGPLDAIRLDQTRFRTRPRFVL